VRVALATAVLGGALLVATGQARHAANPFAGAKLFVDPHGHAAVQVEAWRQTRPAEAAEIAKIASQPQAYWLTLAQDVEGPLQRKLAEIKAANAMALLGIYYIPRRDCGQYSAGGAPSSAAYRRWIDAVAQAIGAIPTAVILESDALPSVGPDCGSKAKQEERLSLLRYGVRRFEGLPATAVYIDAGHAGWRRVQDIAALLRRAGIDQAQGFALNVFNHQTTSDTIAYGRRISALVGGKHFVIDTSRNGLGPLPARLWKKPEDAWCNSPGRALGKRPTARTGDTVVDAFLWIKNPGDSDGACNGGPPPGVWWPEHALGLATRAAY
jgi:endoglucanase